VGRRSAVGRNSNRHSVASHTLPPSFAGTLELKVEKQNTHSDWIKSVAFSPDGKTIVSGSTMARQTIKVWKLLPWSPTNHRRFPSAVQGRVVFVYWVLNNLNWKLSHDVICNIIGHI